MNPYLYAIRVYLAENPLCFGEGNIRPVMEMLYWYYTEHYPIRDGKITDGFKALELCFRSMSFQEKDRMFSQISSLCAAHEEAAFFEGFRAGAQLMMELTARSDPDVSDKVR